MPEDTRFELQFFESLYAREKKDHRVVEILGHLYTQNGKIDEGLRMDRRLVRMRPEDPLANYNLACSLALKGRRREALQCLRQAVDLGYRDFGWMKKDTDLKSLHGYEPFEDFLLQLNPEV